MKNKSKFPILSSPVVMGILNITPDSFYDGGRYSGKKEILNKVEEMISEGAEIIDIGGASSRPGALEVSEEEEWKRILPVIKEVRKLHSDICISIDTYHSGIAARALEHGADMINDISGGTFDNAMPAVIGKYDIPFVIMHIQGRPNKMQSDPEYNNVVDDITSFFRQQIDIFKSNGAQKLILDPGFGFGKTLDHNFSLLKELDAFVSLGYPVMAGLSRKSMINKVLKTKPEEALNGSSVLNTIALLNGAKILRVHDVKEAVEAVKLVTKLKGI